MVMIKTTTTKMILMENYDYKNADADDINNSNCNEESVLVILLKLLKLS